MLETQYHQKDSNLWHQLIDQNKAYVETRQVFLKSCHDRVNLIRKALQNPTERETALQIIPYLTEGERQNLFEELIELASIGHSDIELVRQAIFLLPQSWLLQHIEKVAEPLLEKGTDEEYRRLLELYIQIDVQLAQRLIERALQQENPDIYEVGEDFDNYLKNK